MAQHVVKDEWGGHRLQRPPRCAARHRAHILLRRRKADVLNDLPERIDNDFWLDLETEQERVYRPFERALDELLRLPEWDAPDSAVALSR